MSFRSLVNLLRGKKKHNNICKLCNQAIDEEKKVCFCLEQREHPDNVEVKNIINQKYDRNTLNEVIQLDRDPLRLSHFVDNIYELVEHTPLRNDLTPKTMGKLKDNMVNEICTHLEEFVKEN